MHYKKDVKTTLKKRLICSVNPDGKNWLESNPSFLGDIESWSFNNGTQWITSQDITITSVSAGLNRIDSLESKNNTLKLRSARY